MACETIKTKQLTKKIKNGENVAFGSNGLLVRNEGTNAVRKASLLCTLIGLRRGTRGIRLEKTFPLRRTRSCMENHWCTLERHLSDGRSAFLGQLKSILPLFRPSIGSIGDGFVGESIRSPSNGERLKVKWLSPDANKSTDLTLPL